MAATSAAVASAVVAARTAAAHSAHSAHAPPRVYVNDPKHTSLHAWWEPPAAVVRGAGSAGVAGITGLRLCVREFPKPWAQARVVDVPPTATEATVTGLYPTSTYQLRLAYVLADGTVSAPGQEETADTAAAGCVPADDAERTRQNRKCSVQ
jgi:hypothetical protein